MSLTPHKEKLIAALRNPKCRNDKEVLEKSLKLYDEWIKRLNGLKSKGEKRVEEMVEILNWYKDNFEVELIMKQGSDFLKRQKGQLKLDSSIIEEFLIYLIHPDVIQRLDNIKNLKIGPTNALMSFAFFPESIKKLTEKPNIVIKAKDQDFSIGAEIHYKFSTKTDFSRENTTEGSVILAVLSAECKVNLDKTMFQEAAGTAERLKQGCPVARYYLLVEYLDMTPEDCRLTAIDNVFILRHAKRLPFEKRSSTKEVEKIHRDYPISSKVVWNFVKEIQNFVDASLFDPEETLKRGSFV